MRRLSLVRVAFLFYVSFANVMQNQAEGPSHPFRFLVFFQMVITDTEFSEMLSGSETVKKLKISHSQMDPGLFRRLHTDLQELSLESVLDLDGNLVCIDDFLTNAPF
jgi:hypothetical protein